MLVSIHLLIIASIKNFNIYCLHKWKLPERNYNLGYTSSTTKQYCSVRRKSVCNSFDMDIFNCNLNDIKTVCNL